MSFLVENLSLLKKEYVSKLISHNNIREFVPVSSSEKIPISDTILQKLHLFFKFNRIYDKQNPILLSNINCFSYEGDINHYWLSSKKYDTNYQPFYPTWLLSSFLLALITKEIGFTELIDIGSGDGRLNYSAEILGLRSIGIEIDEDLCMLQDEIKYNTKVNYELLKKDATSLDYSKLKLSRPIFFISAQPELGEMMAKALLDQLDYIGNTGLIGINFMGNNKQRKYSSDDVYYGWSKFIRDYNLKIIRIVTLPTIWTIDQDHDNPYLFALLNIRE